jgi:uncharacterized protein (DUF1501 family)
MMLRRRTALLGLASTITFGGVSLAVAAPAATRKRFVLIILRGALDGMSVVVPYGDANLRVLRAPLIQPEPGHDGGMLDLGGFWGLHPSLVKTHALYGAGDALFVHAVAGPNRSRSHFEAQDMLECGAEERLDTGWLNRLTGLLPAGQASDNAIALGQNMPLVLRGPAPVSSWARDVVPTPDGDFYTRLLAIHDHDPLTGAALANGLQQRGFDSKALAGTAGLGRDAPFVALARTGGRILANPDGPRLAALDLDGWDTHSGQTPRLKHALQLLDEGIAALHEGLGDAWSDTVVMVMTEFGRTARSNGTGGTDHGTATIAFVLGGKVTGGRVQANWPGLAEAQLFEGRDLQPTLDDRSLVKGILRSHFDLPETALGKVFPDSTAASPAAGLLRA